MGASFRIGLKDGALAALTKGRYRKGLAAVIHQLLGIGVLLAVLLSVAMVLIRHLPWFLPFSAWTARFANPGYGIFTWIPGDAPIAPVFSGVLVLFAVQCFLSILLGGSVAAGLVLVILPASAGLHDLFRTNRDGPAVSRYEPFSNFRKGRYLRSVQANCRLLFALVPSLAPGAILAVAAMTFVAIQYGTDAEWYTPRITLRADSFAALVLPILLALVVASMGFIPAFLRSIAYRPVNWLLGAMPNLSPREVVRLAERMTRGHRMDLFMMDLSFLGWGLLALSTCGLGLPFLVPYYEAVQAEAFARLVAGSEEAGFLVRRSRSTRMDPVASHTGSR